MSFMAKERKPKKKTLSFVQTVIHSLIRHGFFILLSMVVEKAAASTLQHVERRSQHPLGFSSRLQHKLLLCVSQYNCYFCLSLPLFQGLLLPAPPPPFSLSLSLSLSPPLSP
ncbi:unnamed protein product [Boreogadus saida]